MNYYFSFVTTFQFIESNLVMFGREWLMHDKIEWANSSCENKTSQRKVQNNISEKWKQ